MLIDPPIDKLIEKIGCRYALVCLVTKRARELQQKIGEEGFDEIGSNPISVAAHEVYDDKVEPNYEN